MSDDEIEPPLSRGRSKVTLKDGTVLTLPFQFFSASSIGTYLKCPRQFWFSYLQGIKKPPSVAMMAGTSGHKALETNNLHKIKRGKDLPKKTVVEAFNDHWTDSTKEVDKSDFAREGQTRDGMRKIVSAPLTQYMEEIAPEIQPVKAEEFFEGKIGAIPVRGQVDLTTADGRIHDYKVCSAGSPYRKASYADQDIQLGVYGAVYKADRVGFICLVKPGKGAKDGTVERVPTMTLKARRLDVRKEVEHVARGVSAGAFPKCPAGSWYCSPKWCGYWSMCRGARPGTERKP